MEKINRPISGFAILPFMFSIIGTGSLFFCKRLQPGKYRNDFNRRIVYCCFCIFYQGTHDRQSQSRTRTHILWESMSAP